MIDCESDWMEIGPRTQATDVPVELAETLFKFHHEDASIRRRYRPTLTVKHIPKLQSPSNAEASSQNTVRETTGSAHNASAKALSEKINAYERPELVMKDDA